MMLKWVKVVLITPVVLGCYWLGSASFNSAQGQSRSLTLRADIQQANAKTGVVTASGNVQLSYPARQIQATSAQAQYYSRERRIILSGNVYILQAGNSLRAETITYLIDEGRFVAVNDLKTQVESVIVVEDQDVPIVDN
jgi:lipopolysaccharide export system protein LptA